MRIWSSLRNWLEKEFLNAASFGDDAAAARWYKSAKEVRDAEGRLLLWEPPADEETPVALVTTV